MKKTMRKISAILTALLLTVASQFVGGELLFAAETKTTGQFVVGMECAYAPYNWTTSVATATSVDLGDNQYCDGFDVMVARKLAEGLNKELVIQKTAWDGLIPSLQSSQIDAIIAGMSPTAERKEEIAFSDVYYRGKFGVIVKKNGTYANAKTINDFADAKVTAQLGTFHVDLIPQLVGVDELAPMKDFPTMTVAAKSGEIDGFISDDATGPTIIDENPDLSYIILEGEKGLQVTDEQTGVAVGLRKADKDLTNQINDILAHISKAEMESYMQDATNAQPVEEEATETEEVEQKERGFFGQIADLWQQYSKMFINGTITTLLISVVATVLGFLLGLLMAIIRDNKIGKWFVTLYVTIIRGTPMMVQAMVIFYGTAFAISGFQWSNIPNGKTIAGILIVTINTGAYMTETIRSGIQALDIGQFEAAKSLGFTRWQTMTNIILPQAIRNVLPALGNEFIVNIKDTSVLNVIGVVELFFMSSSVSGATYKFFPTFTITALIYLLLTTIFSLILNYVEKNLGKVKKKKATSLPASQTDKHFVNHHQK